MSAFSVSEPFPTFHDRDGQPLEGGYLYFGTAGLPAVANQIPVYVDAALTIPAAQPVRTLNGYPQYQGAACCIYVNADDFSITVNDQNNSLVFSSLNATLRIPLATTTGNISSDRVTYIEGSTGSTTRILTSKLQDTVSVFDFMTPAQIADVKAGTLLVDVTAPIAAALAASDDVYFPEGAYRVSNDGTATQGAVQVLNGTAGKSLRGAGRGNTVLKNVGSGPCITSIGNAIIANVSVYIADMTIEGSVGTSHGIFCDYTSQSVFERLEFYQCGGDGLKILRGAHNSVNDVWARVNLGAGLSISGDTFFTTVQGGTFESNVDGVIITIGSGVASPRFVTVTGAAFRSNSNANANIGAANDVRFFGCSFETSNAFLTTRHVSVDGGASSASSIVIDSCSLSGINNTMSTIGFYAAACANVILSKSLVACTDATAYEIIATALRTQILDNCAIAGVRNNASTTTIVREAQSSPSAAIAVTIGTSALPIRLQAPNNVPLIRFADQRVWGNSDNNVYTFNATPASGTDGYLVGPGVEVLTYANLPVSPPVGTRVRVTDSTNSPPVNIWEVWGDIVTGGGGLFSYFITWDGANWRIFGL